MCFWDDQDVELTGIEQASRRFFVRVEAKKETKAIHTFERVSVIEADVTVELVKIRPLRKSKFHTEESLKKRFFLQIVCAAAGSMTGKLEGAWI